mgnify:CR=1 FL=1
MAKRIPVLPRVKPKKKLKHITALMPVFKWEEGRQYIFRLPYTQASKKWQDRQYKKDRKGNVYYNNCKIQIRTHTYNKFDNLIWANIKGNKFSALPDSIVLKDISIGYTLKHKPNYVVWSDKNTMRRIPCSLVDSIMIKGIATSEKTLKDMYNPFKKFSKFTLNHLRNRPTLQLSLHRLVDGYKNQRGENGISLWNEIKSIQTNIWDKMSMIYSKDLLKDLITHRFTQGESMFESMFNIPHSPLAMVFDCNYGTSKDGYVTRLLFTNENYICENLKEHFKRAKNYPLHEIDTDNQNTVHLLGENIDKFYSYGVV